MGKVNIEIIPEEENKAMARCLLTSMKEFFSKPENKKKFEEWEKQRKSA